MRRVAVIGAGIVGASVAFWLTRGGAHVWLVDEYRPGSGTTSASFAWVNANEKTPYTYFELNYAGLREHFKLRNELPEEVAWLHPGGSLEWAGDEAGQERLRRRVGRLRSWGYAAEWRKASWVNEALEPNVAHRQPMTYQRG
jgi:glycine/D-amino acid oxidase-like deaminating enzyme